MYENISAEQPGRDLGCILKTSLDLSTMTVIAHVRQGENVSLSWATASRTDPGTLGGEWKASSSLVENDLPAIFSRLWVQPNNSPPSKRPADNEKELWIISFWGDTTFQTSSLHFLYLTLSVRGLKCDGTKTANPFPFPQRHFCLNLMWQDGSEMKLERHKDVFRSWGKNIYLTRRKGYTPERSDKKTCFTSERVRKNSSLGIKIKLLWY